MADKKTLLRNFLYNHCRKITSVTHVKAGLFLYNDKHEEWAILGGSYVGWALAKDPSLVAANVAKAVEGLLRLSLVPKPNLDSVGNIKHILQSGGAEVAGLSVKTFNNMPGSNWQIFSVYAPFDGFLVGTDKVFGSMHNYVYTTTPLSKQMDAILGAEGYDVKEGVADRARSAGENYISIFGDTEMYRAGIAVYDGALYPIYANRANYIDYTLRDGGKEYPYYFVATPICYSCRWKGEFAVTGDGSGDNNFNDNDNEQMSRAFAYGRPSVFMDPGSGGGAKRGQSLYALLKSHGFKVEGNVDRARFIPGFALGLRAPTSFGPTVSNALLAKLEQDKRVADVKIVNPDLLHIISLIHGLGDKTQNVEVISPEAFANEFPVSVVLEGSDLPSLTQDDGADTEKMQGLLAGFGAGKWPPPLQGGVDKAVHSEDGAAMLGVVRDVTELSPSDRGTIQAQCSEQSVLDDISPALYGVPNGHNLAYVMFVAANGYNRRSKADLVLMNGEKAKNLVVYAAEAIDV